MSLQADLKRLQHLTGFTYRIMLAGLVAVYGRDAVVKELVSICADNGVVSIASAENWCRMRTGDRALKTTL